MVRHIASLLCLVVISACGPAINPAFDGQWTGPVSVVIPGQGGVSYDGRVYVAVQGDRLYISNLCYDGSGRMDVQGAGDTVDWVGELVCPWPPGPACSTSTLRYQQATATLLDVDRMEIEARGILAGCGVSYPVSVTFLGRT